MSWYSGSHDTSTSSSGSSCGAAAMASRLAQIVRCGSITPFGSDVRPAGELQDGEGVGVVRRAVEVGGQSAGRRPARASASDTIGGIAGLAAR